MVLTKLEYNKLEQFLDKIATAVITNLHNFTDDPQAELLSTQKTIRDGILQTGLENADEKKVLFQREIEANADDIIQLNPTADYDETQSSLLLVLYDFVNQTDTVETLENLDINNINVSVNSVDGIYQVVAVYNGITRYLNSMIQNNVPNSGTLNISQFLGLQNQQASIDTEQAIEYLNTNIYELLPTRRARQKRIDDFFKEYSVLKGFLPQWQTDEITDDIAAPSTYSGSHDISQAQDNENATVDEEQAYITRLDINANQKNRNKTLQYLRDDINLFLKDIDQTLEPEVEDSRPIYVNQSTGYLKIRSLNQGIIVRKQEGDDVGLEQIISIPEWTAENPQDGTYNPVVDQISGGGLTYKHPHHGDLGPSYLMDGFTITMWVKFLDRTSKGTLFNYGNPLRDYDPKGFVLETFILNKDEVIETDEEGRTWGDYCNSMGLTTFANNDYARFLRLVVKDHKPYTDGGQRRLYDSRIGYPSINGEAVRKDNIVPEFGYDTMNNGPHKKGDEHLLVQHVQIPIDFDEWFFIVATYNPLNWDNSGYSIAGDLQYETESEDQEKVQAYWKNNYVPKWSTPPGYFHHYSGFGSKCKVEFISKSDLLRARGYAPE